MDLGECLEVDAVVTVYAMAGGAHPDVAIPVFQDGVDLIFGQAWDVWKSGDRFAVPHAQGAALLTCGQVPVETAETIQFFQVDEGVYANVIENAGINIPTQNSSEMGSSWIFHYPLSWIVFTEIYNSTEE